MSVSVLGLGVVFGVVSFVALSTSPTITSYIFCVKI